WCGPHWSSPEKKRSRSASSWGTARPGQMPTPSSGAGRRRPPVECSRRIGVLDAEEVPRGIGGLARQAWRGGKGFWVSHFPRGERGSSVQWDVLVSPDSSDSHYNCLIGLIEPGP